MQEPSAWTTYGLMQEVQLDDELHVKQKDPQGWHCNEPVDELAKYWDAQVVHCVLDEHVEQLMEQGRLAARKAPTSVTKTMEYEIIIF